MMLLFSALAEEIDIPIAGGAKNVIFIGIFFIILFAVFIWWLRR